MGKQNLGLRQFVLGHCGCHAHFYAAPIFKILKWPYLGSGRSQKVQFFSKCVPTYVNTPLYGKNGAPRPSVFEKKAKNCFLRDGEKPRYTKNSILSSLCTINAPHNHFKPSLVQTMTIRSYTGTILTGITGAQSPQSPKIGIKITKKSHFHKKLTF